MALNVKISLTGRAPVTVRDSEWPLVGQHWANDEAKRATSRERSYVKMRRHADGRWIIYGLRAITGAQTKVGHLVDAHDATALRDAIMGVSATVGIPAQQLLNKLPAEAI